MNKKGSLYPVIAVFALLTFLTACNGGKKPPSTDIAASPEQLDVKAKDIIREFLEYAGNNNGDMGDSVILANISLLQTVYEKNNFDAIWSSKEEWKPLGDSIMSLVANAKLYGLFPEDYHFLQLDSINKRFIQDKWREKARTDAALWSKADLLLTDAFFKVVKDIKLGRLPKDSITLRKDSALTDEFYQQQWQALQQSGSLSNTLQALEPRHPAYIELKTAVKRFLDSAVNRDFTIVPSPGKDAGSRAVYKKALQTRLYEGGFIAYDSIPADSVALAEAVKKFQKKQGITVDGKAGEGTLRMLNLSDKEKFVRIAIAMDRYKSLPDTMPSRYLWVNLPSFSMRLWDNDTVKILSKIICGKPLTRTPLLTSAISEMITYPQWTIPNSIIVKEILPGIKRDSAYLAKKGYSLIDGEGNEVDPAAVDWKKYSKGIPYKVVQGSGDDNALGILKFNFNNKYAVYLHDTNQRYLFSREMRSLSHGCVRVQEWQKLAYSILEYDNPDEKKFQAKEDSLTVWLERKEKHSIGIRNRLPVYIRYITCEGKDGNVVFYDDIYGEDKFLKERYFAGK
ncbi:MAG: L,D-transpeptidase family protein [Chitinophagaceae bacterium]|nr:L,D-transpeptidase family protein [Chitinophagaceae bacterium]